MSSISFFDELAEKTSVKINSGRYYFFGSDIHKKIYADIIKKISFEQKDNVLDLGGGTGEIAKYIAQYCGNLTLIDGAEKAVARARENLKKYKNVTCIVCDLRCGLPLEDLQFSKIICYSLVHYLSHEDFKNLLDLLLKKIKPGGLIFIGDIPFHEKYVKNLEERKKNPLNNWILNQKYFLRKNFTNLIYKLNNITPACAGEGAIYTKEFVLSILGKCSNIEYAFFEQSSNLPFFNSREDLLIIKK